MTGLGIIVGAWMISDAIEKLARAIAAHSAGGE